MGEKSPTAFTSDSPLVTIVITSYNYGRTVGEAIASALGQSYENIEVLVLDNASTDDSVEVTRAIRDPRLRIVARKSNIGIQKNHNDGIARARGEYVVFLSADDLLLPNLVTITTENTPQSISSILPQRSRTREAESFTCSITRPSMERRRIRREMSSRRY